MSGANLETPPSPGALYDGTGADVNEHRPVFTGDLFRRASAGSDFLIIQHPCALRRGAHLNKHLLVARVSATGQLPDDWSMGYFKAMPLPALINESSTHTASFTDLEIIPAASLAEATRAVTMSQFGVNLLLQRWVYHNSRVVIPTKTFNDQTSGPFAEAELCAEWVEARSDHDSAAEAAFDAWLGLVSPETGGDKSRRDRLGESQQRSSVRSEMRRELKALAKGGS